MAKSENSLESDDKDHELDVDKEIDINLIQTFPASDPPSWTLGHDHEPKPSLNGPSRKE